MTTFTKYCLPISDYVTAKPWQRSDNASFFNIYDVVNDQPGNLAEMASEPALDAAVDAYGCGSDGEVFYPQRSLWNFTPNIPLTATNILVTLGGYLAHSPIGPSPRQTSWMLWDAVHQVVLQAFNVTTPFTTSYLKYEWSMGATNPLINAAWTPTAVNGLLAGLEATANVIYYTRCATYWMKVTYDDNGLPAVRPRRSSAILF